VFTEEGTLIASFTQDGMIRSFGQDHRSLARSADERL
jgi:hypothetical protein